jgi:para-aminobenzoate synthetase/4-amino-4-deoxychorismate lyase
VGWDAYQAAIAAIKEHIARGDTYQVNYTLRLRQDFSGDAWNLFRSLAPAPTAGYPAFVDIGRYAVCSLSPELFFERQGERVTARPMKGTAPRGRWAAEDAASAEWLRTSAKNRAENVMIVDMLRNDLGRVAKVGSVEVPRLFEVERYPTVWQMTSTVTARTDASMDELFAALFPCASITGAPKTRTTQIIAGLETEPRRIYTGAIGFFGPDGAAQFNVAIRTVLVDRREARAEYGVGGGIVWDSDACDEYEECRQKARVLSEPQEAFGLFETLLWSPETGGYWLLDYHLRRLEASAEYFGFALPPGAAAATLAGTAQTFGAGAYRVRLLADADGRLQVDVKPLGLAAPVRSGPDGMETARPPVRLALAPAAVDSRERWLYHKTTRRQTYTTALAARPEADDVVLWNERGEATETCIGNLVARIDGRLVTPPLSSGLLPGTLRAWLLDQGVVSEEVVRVEQLEGGEVYRINGVRGWERAEMG